MVHHERSHGEPVTHLVAPVACRCGGQLVYENGSHGRLSLARAVLKCTAANCHRRYLVTVEMTMLDVPTPPVHLAAEGAS